MVVCAKIQFYACHSYFPFVSTVAVTRAKRHFVSFSVGCFLIDSDSRTFQCIVGDTSTASQVDSQPPEFNTDLIVSSSCL